MVGFLPAVVFGSCPAPPGCVAHGLWQKQLHWHLCCGWDGVPSWWSLGNRGCQCSLAKQIDIPWFMDFRLPLDNSQKTVYGPKEKKCSAALDLWFFQLCAVSERRGKSSNRRCCLEYNLWDLVSSGFSLTFPTSFVKLKLSAISSSAFSTLHWKVQDLLIFPLRQLLQPLNCVYFLSLVLP